MSRRSRLLIREHVMAGVRDWWDRQRITMTCPTCGRKMVVRQNRENGSRFLGCVGWPEDCQATAPIPAYVIAKASGAASLPGFG